MTSIKELLKEIDNLKPISHVAHKLMEITEEPACAMSDIANVIQYDPLITANLLKTCNSAYFGLQRKVDSVHDAIILLGLEQVVELALIRSVAEDLKKKQEGYGLHEGELWKQSVTTALIARGIAEMKGAQNRHLIFTAALLKDIGKVILDRYVAEAFFKINVLVERKGFRFEEAEKLVIGMDHAELGALVAEKWKFSPKMIYIIKNHHMPDGSAKEHLETAIVYLADTLSVDFFVDSPCQPFPSTMLAKGEGGDELAYPYYDAVLDLLGISEADIDEILAGFDAGKKKIEGLLNCV